MNARWILTGLLATSLPVAAQYRDGEPPTMPAPERPAPDDDAPAVDAFRAAYARAGAPRIVVFWNRTFGDELREARMSVRSTQVRRSADAKLLDDTTSGPAGSSRLAERTATSGVDTTVREGGIVTNATPRAGPNEKAIWIVEAEFGSQLARAGVLLVDRAAIMRTTHLAQSAARGNDPRTIETAALEGKADLLLEVLLTPDGSAPSGWLYRITVKSVKTGAMLAHFVSQGLPPPRDAGRAYVATDRGFARPAPPGPPSLNAVARSLGLETMQQLGPRLATLAPARR